ncbi:MAG TPA: hypothetical protein PLD27_11880 [bacterium]|nr:hypothetical protein [bacterium]HOL48661.1 hypothetical protein [bacterium]HPQ20150.1 hypothetical protein [bacterium]
MNIILYFLYSFMSSIRNSFIGKEQADDGTAKIAKLNILSKKSIDILLKIYIKKLKTKD